MAKVLIDESTLANIADAIRDKKGTTALIDPANYADEINEITTIISPILQEKTVTDNGEVTPDEGYDGLSKVIVDVTTGVSIDNSYTVNFYNDNGILFESHTTTCGMEIIAPVSFTADNWIDSDDNIVEFPFTSNIEDVYNFTAVVSG